MKPFIPEGKITDYLLNINHPVGWSKAKFFLSHGFDVARPEELASALCRHYEENSHTEQEIDSFGNKRIVIIAPMTCPDGRSAAVLSVWQVRADDQSVVRLISAYPSR